jgi:hypothetical protein
MLKTLRKTRTSSRAQTKAMVLVTLNMVPPYPLG